MCRVSYPGALNWHLDLFHTMEPTVNRETMITFFVLHIDFFEFRFRVQSAALLSVGRK